MKHFSIKGLVQREQLYHITVNSNVWPIAAVCLSSGMNVLRNSQSSAENECV